MQTDVFPFPLMRVGIIGGGQLAKMMVQKARQMGIFTAVLDPDPTAPAAPIADRFILGSLDNIQSLRELASSCDVTTYDIEHIDAAALEVIAGEGHVILPSPARLAQIQDKLIQKRILEQRGLPVPSFAEATRADAASCAAFGYPLVQKLRRGGYDGRGVSVLHSDNDLHKLLQGDSMFEECVDILCEVAVLVARSRNGDMRAYDPVEMVFDQQHNVLDVLLAPARIPSDIALQARHIAERAAEAFDLVGICAVELFVTRDSRVLINEIAPRPHNSGHHTIEACETSQFEQHLRAVCGLPLGNTALMRPACMLNLLGAPEAHGAAKIFGLHAALSIEGLSLHLYGKHEVRPARKMGHVTILADTVEQALERGHQAKKFMTISGEHA